MFRFRFKKADRKIQEAKTFFFSVGNGPIEMGAHAGDFESLAVLSDLFFLLHFIFGFSLYTLAAP
jgi:hypothetical protein